MGILTIERVVDNFVSGMALHPRWNVELPDKQKAEVYTRGGVHLFIFDKNKEIVGALDGNDILHIFGSNGKIIRRQRWAEIAAEYKAKGYEILTSEELVNSPGFTESMQVIGARINEKYKRAGLNPIDFVD